LGVVGVVKARANRNPWNVFAAPRLRAALIKRSSSLPRWLALLLLIAACASMIFALARPRSDAGIKTEKTLGRNVLVALDISKSMRVADVKPDRLTQAKVVIYELLEAMPNERFGFIGFAGDAHTYAPLTVDHSAVRETVEQIDESWAPLGGSDLAAAIHLATETLKKTGQKNNALVILSDGEKHTGDLEAMIAEAEQSGVYIIAIGVGTESGGIVPNPSFPNGQMLDRSGQVVISRLQGEVMRELAEKTKGRYAVAGSGLDLTELVKSVVKDLDVFQMDARERSVFVEYYQWLVLPSIFFLALSIIAGTRWKGIRLWVAIGAGFLTWHDAKAGGTSEAKSALLSKDGEKARDLYHRLAGDTRSPDRQARYRLGEATAAYQVEDFLTARTAFTQSLASEDPQVLASGHLGMANTLFQLGWKGLSGEPYPAPPAAIPDLNRFDTIAKEAIAKLRGSDASDEGDSAGYSKIESLITNWADAVRHYDSVLKLVPADPLAGGNRQLALKYLKRFEELLKEEKEEAEQAMPQPQPGKGQPQDGDGDPNEGKNGDKSKKKGAGKDEKGDKDGENGEDPKDEGKDKGKEKDKDQKKDKGDGDPNESPEQRARRILKENSDLEKGPITPGQREFKDPEKDW
jgi:Ca-activated chloride channel family protein